MTLADTERRMLLFRLTVVGLAALGLWYFLPQRGEAAPMVGGGVGVYVAYALLMILVLTPRVPSHAAVYILALVDVAALLVVLYTAPDSQGTPFVAMVVLVAIYYSSMYGFGPGVAAAAILGAGCAIVYLQSSSPMASDPTKAISLWVPLIVAMALMGGFLHQLREVGPEKGMGFSLRRLFALRETRTASEVSGALLISGARSREPKLRLGSLRINRTDGEVVVAGTQAHFSPTEVQLLETLAQHAGHTISQEQVLRTIWGESYRGGMNVVNVTVHRLRRKLDRYGYAGLVLTVRGKGYMLDAAQLEA